MSKHIFNGFFTVTGRPQKFLEVHRVHLVIFFVAHAVALDFAVVHAEHGTAAYYIESAVNTKEFECGGNFGKLRYFVKKYKRFSRNEFCGGFYKRYIFYDIGCGIPVRYYRLVFFVPYKIYLDNAVVVFGGKMENGLRLAHLTASLYYERLSRRLVFPLIKKIVDFSFQIHCYTPGTVINYIIHIS